MASARNESRSPTGRAGGHGLKIALSLAVSAVLLVLAVRQVNGAELGGLVQRANYLDVAVAVAIYFLDLAIRSARWSVLLRRTKHISVRRLYPVLAIGYMANNLLPGRVGELSRAYLVGRREGVSATTVLASVIIERIVDGLTVLILLAATLALLPFTRTPDSWILLITRLAAISFGLAVVGCVALVAAPAFWLGLVQRAVAILPPRFGKRVVRLVHRFVDGFAILADPVALAETLALSIGVWIVGAMAYLMVAAAFGVRLSLVEAVLAICVVNLATAVPQAPAGLGAFEAAAEGVLVLLGVGTTTAFGITIVLHAVLFVPVVVVGLIFLWRADLSLGSLWSGTRYDEAPSRPASPIEVPR